MTALTDMETARTAAGATYAAALTALHNAYVDLAAYDFAVSNRNVGRKNPSNPPTLTFDGTVNAMPHGLLHPEFATDDHGAMGRDALAQGKVYLATLGQS